MSGVKYLGVTEPVSTAAPTPADEKRTAELETFLQQAGRYESRSDKAHRETVLATLSGILNTWVRNVSLSLEPPLTDPGCHRAHVFSFGSYRLGVNASDADIDTAVVVPQHIDTTRDFFGLEPPDSPDTGNQWRNDDNTDCILQEVLLRDPRVTDLVAVSGAFTPIITFLFNGVEIDIACGIVAFTTLPQVQATLPPPPVYAAASYMYWYISVFFYFSPRRALRGDDRRVLALFVFTVSFFLSFVPYVDHAGH